MNAAMLTFRWILENFSIKLAKRSAQVDATFHRNVKTVKIRTHLHILVNFILQTLPEDATVIGCGDVREKRVSEYSFHGIGISRCSRARCHAEESIFRIDRPEFATFVESHPSNVISNAFDLVAWKRRLHHREIRLATGARKRGRYVTFLASGIRDSQNLSEQKNARIEKKNSHVLTQISNQFDGDFLLLFLFLNSPTCAQRANPLCER